MGDSLGKLFTITGFGESHGACMGVVVDGCPAGLPLAEADIQPEVERRRPGAAGTTERWEPDKVEITSGVYDGHTTGAPICMLTWNKDIDSGVYKKNRFALRPGHADYTAFMKYGGFNDFRGGGRFSGRITLAYVMAGAIARKLIGRLGIDVFAHTVAIGGIKARTLELASIKGKAERDPLWCADPEAADKMARLIEKAREEKDSLGGVIEGIALNVPVGLGEPVFDNLDGELSKALFAIPAVKGVEFGAGFAVADMKGSENNDLYDIRDGKIVTRTNNAGGVLGGISTGMPVLVRVAVKPTASIARSQETVDIQKMAETNLTVTGRHDTCIVPRAVPGVEAMMAVTICDFALRAGLITRVLT
ncbi:MAG: chorismate synthase [Dehalococcoidales bacterium]|nr:chorismate synthase [Dehalococcoidales bacterium]